MRAAASALAEPVALPDKGWLSIVAELTKARLTLLVVLTTWVGFYVGSAGAVDWVRLLNTVAGTGLLASGAAILNQYLEREWDGRMRRTADRPLPSGRMTADAALLLGASASVAGMVWLAAAANPLAAFLGGLTLVCYLFVYTPLKRLTVLNTVVGAVPGALPPLLGWAAATGGLEAGGWSLFGILFFWQLPHFFAIAWLYREDYQKAGFRMLSGADPDGRRTGASAVRNTLALCVASLFPYLLGLAGRLYLAGAIGLGALFLLCAAAFARQPSKAAARRLFFASILYLPLILGLLVADQRRPVGQGPGSLRSQAAMTSGRTFLNP